MNVSVGSHWQPSPHSAQLDGATGPWNYAIAFSMITGLLLHDALALIHAADRMNSYSVGSLRASNLWSLNHTQL